MPPPCRRRYSRALQLLLTALTAPTMVLNAITVACLKKYILVQLLTAGERVLWVPLPLLLGLLLRLGQLAGQLLLTAGELLGRAAVVAGGALGFAAAAAAGATRVLCGCLSCWQRF